MRRSLSEHDARRMLVAGPVILITTKWRGSTDVTPVAWAMPLSATPPLVGVCVHPSRHAHDMIRWSEEFALNIPGPELLNHVAYFGSVSGKDVDKLDVTKLPTTAARKIEAPLLEGCVGWIECGVEDAIRVGDHTLFVGRVAAVSGDDEAFNELWLLNEPAARPLHYLGGLSYATLDRRLEARPPRPSTATTETIADQLDRQREEREETAADEREQEQRG
jgi:flavin reductase (DIM6/NTAB) family NADH-FMN oxidoreductase RutF